MVSRHHPDALKVFGVLCSRVVGYHTKLAFIVGGPLSALFLSQMLYWHGKGARSDGWIWKTQTELTEETGLTRRHQATARKKLRALGILEEKKMGIPGKLYYRINVDNLLDMVMGWREEEERHELLDE